MDNLPMARTTTLKLPDTLYTEIKVMCLLTNKSMGDFIRRAIKDKINHLKDTQINPLT